MIAATLIFNEEAGSSKKATPEGLITALAQAGYQATHLQTKDEDDLASALTAVTGVIFVAGGDGTVRGVAKHVAGRADVSLALIPMGTSNNIAHTLGLTGPPEEVARSYGQAQLRPFDAGRITAPWGHDLFFEACGCGIFADVLAAYDPEEQKSPLRAAQAIVTTLPSFEPLDLALSLDGRLQAPLPLALLEVMNIRATGNNMKLATSADPGDGRLNVIRVDAAQRNSFLAYAAALARDDFEALPSVLADEAQTIQIPYLGQAFHVDGEVRPAQTHVVGTVDIQVWPVALQVLEPVSSAP